MKIFVISEATWVVVKLPRLCQLQRYVDFHPEKIGKKDESPI